MTRELAIWHNGDVALSHILKSIPATLRGDDLREACVKVVTCHLVSDRPTAEEAALMSLTVAALVRLKELERL